MVKAGAEVKIGDIIEIQFGGNTTKIEVLDLKESTKKKMPSICTKPFNFIRIIPQRIF